MMCELAVENNSGVSDQGGSCGVVIALLAVYYVIYIYIYIHNVF